MKKPEVGEFYKNRHGYVYKVVFIDDTSGIAVVEYIDEDIKRTWNYRMFPEQMERKLTPLEVELL
jgi:hypothetical protein